MIFQFLNRLKVAQQQYLAGGKGEDRGGNGGSCRRGKRERILLPFYSTMTLTICLVLKCFSFYINAFAAPAECGIVNFNNLIRAEVCLCAKKMMFTFLIFMLDSVPHTCTIRKGQYNTTISIPGQYFVMHASLSEAQTSITSPVSGHLNCDLLKKESSQD